MMKSARRQWAEWGKINRQVPADRVGEAYRWRGLARNSHQASQSLSALLNGSRTIWMELAHYWIPSLDLKKGQASWERALPSSAAVAFPPYLCWFLVEEETGKGHELAFKDSPPTTLAWISKIFPALLPHGLHLPVQNFQNPSLSSACTWA